MIKTPDNTFRNGFDAAIKGILDYVKAERKRFHEQSSIREAVVCNMLAREITERFQCEVFEKHHTCPNCKLPCGKNYHHALCFDCKELEEKI